MSTSTQSIKKRNSRLPTGNTKPHRRLLNNRLGFSSFSLSSSAATGGRIILKSVAGDFSTSVGPMKPMTGWTGGQ